LETGNLAHLRIEFVVRLPFYRTAHVGCVV
jgi:hypothetical protein